MLYPWEYTETESSEFKPWDGTPVSYQQLKKLVGTGDTVIINSRQVHCLIFESSDAGFGNYARWDCINGWTTTISQARKRFPLGYHGVKPIIWAMGFTMA